jgi:hypothetical protein
MTNPRFVNPVPMVLAMGISPGFFTSLWRLTISKDELNDVLG